MSTTKTITIDQLKPGMFVIGMDQPWYRTPFLFHKRLVRHQQDIDLLRQHGIKEVTIDPSKGHDLDADSPEKIPQPDRAEHDRDSQPSGTEGQADAHATATAEGHSSGKASQTDCPDRPVKTDKDLPAPGTQKGGRAPKDQGQTADHAATWRQDSPEDARPSDRAERETTPFPPNARVETADQATSANSGPAKGAPQSHDAENLATPLQAPPAEESAPPSAREQAEAAKAAYTEATCSMKRLFEELEAGIVPQPEALRKVVWSVMERVLDDTNSMLSLLYLQKMQRFDRTLASHALDVCTLALIVAQAYGVPKEEMEALGAGALLHDIGYIRLPRNLYRKNHELTAQENAVMQQHPALGLAILREAHEDREAVRRIVGEHQECGDGSGFPNKIKQDALSGLAQLVGLVDVYDGMISRRSGRPAMLPHDAIRQLFQLGDRGQFPKDLIEAAIRSLGVYPIGSLVSLNTGEQAVVVAVNPAQRLKPIVKVITGPQGGSYLTPIRVDLAVHGTDASMRSIAKVLDPLHERVNVALFLDGIEPEAA